jgi:MGT family glycosyltransferase
MSRLLFVATSIPGHVIPLRLTAAEMVRRGHHVTFVTSPQFGPQIQATGARFVPTHGAAAFEVMELVAQRDHLPPGPEQLNWEWQRLFVDAVPVQHELIRRELDAAGDEPVVLVTDSTCFGGWPSRLGAPGRRPAASIILGVTILTVTSADTAPTPLGIEPDGSEEGRARNAAMNAQFEGLFAPTQSHLQAVLQDLGASEPPPFVAHGMSTMADRTLQLCPASFEYPRSDLPAGVRFIGPLPQPFEGDFDAPHWWGDVLAAERVVVVTQGTVANTDHTALFQPALAGLADLDALVVVTTGVEGTVIENAPSNARVGGFVPFDLLLPHADVLITNAGYGGVLKALTHGVPMVVAGDTEDKPAVAAHVAWSGTGIDLRTGHPSAQAVGDAVRQVLSDPSYAQTAAAMRTEIADHHPFDEIEATINELLTTEQARSSATAG